MAVAPLLAGLLAGTAAPGAQAAEQVTGSRTVKISLTTFSPGAPVTGDTLTISGSVTNEGRVAISASHVDLRVGPELPGRTAIDEAAALPADVLGDIAPVGGKYSVDMPTLNPGVPHSFALSVPVNKLGLGPDGTYELGVSLTGETAAAPGPQLLGIERTYLPWQPEEAEKKTRLTFLWPLISSVHLSAETGSDEQQTPVFNNDDLARELAPGGRLEQMVALGSQLPVTWVIDPDLLATADAMTRNYRVKQGDTTVPGTNQAFAAAWLDSLGKAVQGKKVIALPFGDPDLASLAHRGKGVSGALSHLQSATEVASKTVDTILHVAPSTDFAWPVSGAIDPSIVDVATSAGAHDVIARSDSLEDQLDYTPSASRPIGGGTTAVVADAQLSTAFQGDMASANASTLAIQQFLSQTLALTLQEPDNQRSVVVAPQRMPTAAQAQAMANALHQLDPERWTEPADLISAATAAPDPDANTQVPPASRYPKALRQAELPAAAFDEIKNTQDSLDSFKAILSSPDRVEAPFSNAINRSMSTSWREHPISARNYRNGVRSYLATLSGEVELIPKSDLTLSGRSATIPVTVQNKLLQGVENLVLHLQSENPSRLKIDGTQQAATAPIKIGGGHSQSVKFTAVGNANGPVSVVAQLYTADKKPYGDPMTFTVKVSEITPTVMLVIAGGVLLLVLAGVRMYSQRKRAAARKDAATEPEEAAEDAGYGVTHDRQSTYDATATEDPYPGQPSDPAPDTGPESPDASGTGEKVDR